MGLLVRWVDLAGQGDALAAFGRANRVNSPGELRRAAQMSGARTARDFLASRTALRMIVRDHAKIDCYGTDFAVTPNRKPYLPGDPVHFSLSRADGLAVVALHDRPVGIDVERNRVLPRGVHSRLEQIVRQMGAGANVPTGRPANPGNAPQDIRNWTYLEALIKLSDGRLGERFADWAANGPGELQALTRKQRILGDRPVTALAVPVPSGYTSTCCVSGACERLDAAAFRMDGQHG